MYSGEADRRKGGYGQRDGGVGGGWRLGRMEERPDRTIGHTVGYPYRVTFSMGYTMDHPYTVTVSMGYTMATHIE